jgi:hypothetical protein
LACAGVLAAWCLTLDAAIVAQDPPSPTFAFGFGGYPEPLAGAEGDVLVFDAFLTLTTSDNPSPRGAQGWSASFGIEGGAFELLTLDGVIASTVYYEDHDQNPETPPILHSPCFQDLGALRDEGGFLAFGLGFHTQDPNRKGGVIAIALSLTEDKSLQPEGTQPFGRLRVSTPVGSEDSSVRLYYEDGFRSASGMSVSNVATFSGASIVPELGSVTLPVRSTPPVPFKLGDLNADAKQDISDAIFGLGYLFLGGPRPTCLKSADMNGDNGVDISDPVFLLRFLFLHETSPREPYRDCGLDPLTTRLPCAEFPPCAP